MPLRKASTAACLLNNIGVVIGTLMGRLKATKKIKFDVQCRKSSESVFDLNPTYYGPFGATPDIGGGGAQCTPY